jgi:anaerobic magnesium-protoporphyrin IX monomethyl ester cyclase
MRILLVNPSHPAIGSRIPHEHLPPLGLPAIGGPLLEAGHEVRPVDAKCGPMSTREVVAQAVTFAPQAILIGHSGSTSGHPAAVLGSALFQRETVFGFSWVMSSLHANRL